MEALEAPAARGAADATRELGPQRPLLAVCALQARPELRVLGRRARPSVDAAGGLEARDLRDEVRAGDPELRRKRRAALVEGLLLGDRRQPEGAPDRDAAERAWPAAELARDDLDVVHAPRLLAVRTRTSILPGSVGAGAIHAAIASSASAGSDEETISATSRRRRRRTPDRGAPRLC